MSPQEKYKIPSQPFSSDNSDKLSDEMVYHSIPKDEKNYLISFSNYKKKNCEIDNLERASLRKIINWIKEIGLSSSMEEVKSPLKVKPVRNKNDYKELFSHLSPDVEMKEACLSDSSRLFFYIDEANKIVSCVLIKNSHFETGKIRR